MGDDVSEGDLYAVMGNPIAHSKSPRIHSQFAADSDQRLTYRAILVEQGQFPAAVAAFRERGGSGLNVTVPFKEEAWALANRRSARAERAGAVNTLQFETDGAIFGDNTDGVGLVADLTANHGVEVRGARVLLLGAGGAVRGVLGPLLDEAPAELLIANRTVARAETLAELFADSGVPIAACGFDELAGRQFDLVINGTSASLKGELPPLPDGLLAVGATCYDMMYGSEPTPFLRWAAQHGAAHRLDGLGMLVEQAAEAFALWRGVRPATGPVIAALRREMQRPA